MLVPDGFSVSPSLFRAFHDIRADAVLVVFLELSPSQCNSMIQSLTTEMLPFFQLISKQCCRQRPLNSIFAPALQFLKRCVRAVGGMSASAPSVSPNIPPAAVALPKLGTENVFCVSIGGVNPELEACSSSLIPCLQIVFRSRKVKCWSLCGSLRYTARNDFQAEVTIPFLQVPKISSSTNTAPAVHATVESILHTDIAALVDLLSPFTKLFQYTFLDDQMIACVFGSSDSEHRPPAVFVPQMVSVIVKCQNRLTSLLNQHSTLNLRSLNQPPTNHASGSKSCLSVSSFPSVLLHKLIEALTALQMCMERKVVSLLRLDLKLAVDSILYKSSPQILISMGQYLCKVISEREIVPFDAVSSEVIIANAQAHVSCHLCNSSPLFEYFQPKSQAICVQCHAAVCRSHSDRPCDLLGVYALKLLRGEVSFRDKDMNSVLKVFEYVYPSAEFSVSKAALVCICSTFTSLSFSANSLSPGGISEIVIPRWAAHALFPEYSVNVLFKVGENFLSQYAATLGWCVSNSHRTIITPLESAVLGVLQDSAGDNRSQAASISGIHIL
jgi:hypothetical protein